MDRIAVAGKLTHQSRRESGLLTGRVVRQSVLGARERQAMFELLSSCFIGVDRDTFEKDLAGKNWAILLEDDEGQLRGFSTLLVYRPAPGAPWRRSSIPATPSWTARGGEVRPFL